MMEGSAKDYAKQRWKAASHRKRERGRGRGGFSVGRHAEAVAVSAEGELKDEQRDVLDSDRIPPAEEGGVPDLSVGADLESLLQDCHLQQVQAHFRHRSYVTLHDEEIPPENSDDHAQDLVLDLGKLAACLTSVQLHELMRVDPEDFGETPRHGTSLAAPPVPLGPLSHHTTPHSASPSSPQQNSSNTTGPTPCTTPAASRTPSAAAPRPIPRPISKRPADNHHVPAPAPPHMAAPASAPAPYATAAAIQQTAQDADLDHLLSLTASQQPSRSTPPPSHQPPQPILSPYQPPATHQRLQPAAAGATSTASGAARATSSALGAAATPRSQSSVLDALDELLDGAPTTSAQARGTARVPTAQRWSTSTTTITTTIPSVKTPVGTTFIAAPARPASTVTAAASSSKPQPQPAASSTSLDDWLDNL